MLPFSRQALARCSSSLIAQRTSQQASTRIAGVQRRWLTMEELNRQRSGRERVVVLGSGWAGYTLSQDLDHKKYQVVVVSPRSYFVFTPLLASTSTGTLEFRNALEPIRRRNTHAQFLQGWADGIDFTGKTLQIEEAVDDPRQAFALTADPDQGKDSEERQQEKKVEERKGKIFEMDYDKICITVGCYSQTFNTPGVKENAYFLKDVGDARRIRNRLLACFETASLPTTSVDMKKALLHFAVVGGGPTGIEWSAELHDLISEDMARIYPDLVQYTKITVYDVADKVLSMFDEKLAEYATKTFQRERIEILTSHHVEELRRGSPAAMKKDQDVHDENTCYTLKIKEQGEVAVGMCVWSTGLMMNPFVQKSLAQSVKLPVDSSTVIEGSKEGHERWTVKKHPKNGGIITDDRLRTILVPEGSGDEPKAKAVMKDVFALGDCAVMENAMYPATAQVANQKAVWLAKRLNKQDLDQVGFTYKDLGVMAYIGNWNAILQSSGGNVSGRIAWFIWRGAYLAKSVSWRNRILILTYWAINFLFGRDVSRF